MCVWLKFQAFWELHSRVYVFVLPKKLYSDVEPLWYNLCTWYKWLIANKLSESYEDENQVL